MKKKFTKKYYNLFMKYGFSKKAIKEITKSGVALLLSFCVLLSVVSPMMGILKFNSKAAEVYFGIHTLDATNGPASDEWLKTDPKNNSGQPDNRYAGYNLTLNPLGTANSPYIIKDADELSDLAKKVNAGQSFVNTYIDIQGLNQNDLDQIPAGPEKKYYQKGVIDLRIYDGTGKSATETLIWKPIGTSINPFGGVIFSSTNVSVVNLTYKSEMAVGTSHGLFGVNNGTIGVKPDGTAGGFSVSFTSVATEAGAPKNLILSDNASFNAVGGLVGTNNGTVKNITVGKGCYYDPSNGNVTNDYNMGNVISLPKTQGTTANNVKYGGVVGYNTGTVENCSFFGTINASTNAFSTASPFNIGGIVGASTAAGSMVIKDCVFDGTINLPITSKTTKAPSIVGGIVGKSVKTLLQNCKSYGEINVAGEDVAPTVTPDKAGAALGGIGGIAGYTDSSVSYCISDAKILVDKDNKNNPADITKNLDVEKSVLLAGIVAGFNSGGSPSVPKIENCIFTGSIIARDHVNGGSYTGGISAFAGSNTQITKSAFAGEIFIEKTASINDNSQPIGATGGIVGWQNDSGTLDSCFSTGAITGGDNTGGIAGMVGTNNITYSYSNAAIRASSKYTLDYYNIGGLLGKYTVANDSVYYSGSTLSSQAGSLFGYQNKANASDPFYDSTKSYYDVSVSPNQTEGRTEILNDSHGITTNVLINVFSSDTTNWVTTAGNYPQLKWAANISSDANSTKEYQDLVSALSQISTRVYINVNAANAVKNNYTEVSKQLNIYQLKDVTNNSLYLTNPTITIPNGTVLADPWNTGKIFTGRYNGNVLGYEWGKTYSITIGDRTYKTNVIKKALKTINITDGSATLVNSANFFDFLDISNIAGGAYVGGSYYLNADVSASASKIKDLQNPNGSYFASRFNGNNYSISNFDFEINGYPILGNAVTGASVQNVNFKNITYGKNTNKYETSKGAESDRYRTNSPNAGLIFGTIKDTTVKSVGISDLTMYYGAIKSETNTKVQFGFVSSVATNSTVSDVTLNNFNVDIGQYSLNSSISNNELYKIDTYGSLIGKANNVNTYNCNATNTNLVFDIYELQTFNDSSIGGFIGIAVNCATINDMSFAGSIRWKPVSSGGSWLHYTGGIIGYVKDAPQPTYKNLVVTADLESRSMGGLIGRITNGNINLSNCYFIGNMTVSAFTEKEFFGGGLIGENDNRAISLNNCYSFGNFSGRSIGGLMAHNTSGGKLTLNNCYTRANMQGVGASASAGGFVSKKIGGSININNSYYVGQITGAVNAGAFVGVDSTESNNISVSKSAYDKSISGGALYAVSNRKTPYANFTANYGVDTAAIDVALLGNQFIAQTETNYPELKAFSGSSNVNQKTSSHLSTKKIFKTVTGSTLTKTPDFDLQEDAAEGVTVTKADGWADVLTNTGNHYSVNQPGNTVFSVDYANIPNYNGKTLRMNYEIIVKPLDYGEGTEDMPYIIYNEAEFLKFKQFLDKGFDKAGIYYKIGSVDTATGTIIGAPITIDLSKIDGDASTLDEWEPIMGFAGHLDGNNSQIINLNCTQGKTIVEQGGVQKTYYGLFATCGASAVCNNLTISNANSNAVLSSNKSNSRLGALVAEASGGTFDGITIEDVKITANSSNSNVGGAIGTCVATGGSIKLNDFTVIAELTNTTFNTNPAGGIVGLADGIRLEINKSASYGTINNFGSSGGLLGAMGRQSQSSIKFEDSASMMDITSNNSGAYIGGLLGRSDLSISSANDITILNSIYGGRLEGNETNSYIGGLIGQYQMLVDINKTNPFKYGATPVPFGSGTKFSSEAEIKDYFTNINKEIIKNSYYAYDTNHTEESNINYQLNYVYYTDSANTKIASGSFDYNPKIKGWDISNYRSNVLAMTKAEGIIGFTGIWAFEEGLYPRLKNDVTLVNNPNTAQNDSRISDKVTFSSIAIHYTNADKFFDNTFSNIFVRFDGSTFNSPVNDSVVLTQNERMLQSTKVGAQINQSLSWTSNSDSSGTYTKNIAYIPSTVSCGISDYSFYFANPNGMWVKSIEDKGETTNYPWTLYTADQLNGLASLTAGEKDGNGLTSLTPDFNVSFGSGHTGETISLGVDIDAGAYSSFRPIGDETKPFSQSFNGLGYTISNIHLNSNTGHKNLGLFGGISNASISNVGIVSGEILINDTTEATGAISAKMLGNSVINSCFSSIGTMGNGGKSVSGGIVGSSSGSGNNIRASFNTGYVFIKGDNTVAGGIIGSANGISVKDSYVSAYIDANKYGVVAGTGTPNVSNTYYDLNGTGEIDVTNGAIGRKPTANELDKNVFNTNLGNGFYPLQSVFFHNGNNLSTLVSASIVPVELTNARSTTEGKVTLPGATINYVQSSYSGTVANKDGVIFTPNDSFTEFKKADSGIAFLRINYNGSVREIIANLQCWFDAGSATGKYKINTAKELAEFSAIVNGTLTAENNPNGLHTHGGIPFSFVNKTVSLGSNIDFSLTDSATLQPIGTTANPFKGTFDGNGKIISNLQLTSANDDGFAALFGVVDNATIKNIGINSGTITANANISAGLVAKTMGKTEIKGCFTNIAITGGQTAGGIAGITSAGTTIDSCYNMGDISISGDIGGIATQNNGTISNSYNVGILKSSLGTAAGISYDNSGKIVNCYNAAYVKGSMTLAISNKNVESSSYDSKLLNAEDLTAVSGVSNKISMTDEKIWNINVDYSYPELKYFSAHESSAMQDASELSVLKLDFADGIYKEFVSASLKGSVTTNSKNYDVSVSQNGSGDAFSIVLEGGYWKIKPNSNGPFTLTSSTNGSGVEIKKSYYVVAVITMKIRYKFDFTELFAKSQTLPVNTSYHGTATSSDNTFNASDKTVLISTADDLISFAEFVNSGAETKGKTFKLDYNIDMAGKTMPVIGSAQYPFNGKFDGGSYTISNLSITASSSSAMFGYIGQSGKILNFTLDKLYVTANHSNDDIYVAGVCAINEGIISNVAITEGFIKVNNSSFSLKTYLGTIVAKNMGKIRGCYFIQNQEKNYGIEHYSKTTDFAGGLVGYNRGSIIGCYLVSNMYNANIDGLVGDNGNRTEGITNCYFNVNAGDSPPVNIPYAYDEVEFTPYFVTASQMKSKEFASWLSSNIYAGTYEMGTASSFVGKTPQGDEKLINNGYPYLSNNELAKYDLTSYFGGKNEMILSIWNVEDNDKTQTTKFSNGMFVVGALDYKFFADIVTHEKIQFNMSVLPPNINYDFNVRVYGRFASFNADTTGSGDGFGLSPASQNAKEITSGVGGKNDKYTISASDYISIQEANLTVVTISLSSNEGYTDPWGVKRTWSAIGN